MLAAAWARVSERKHRRKKMAERTDGRSVFFTSQQDDTSAEGYSQRANTVFEAELGLRTAAQEGAFFLPHLRPGMRVLDLGCGPGSITLGLAEAVAPGDVVGIDLQPSQVAQAQALSAATWGDEREFRGWRCLPTFLPR